MTNARAVPSFSARVGALGCVIGMAIPLGCSSDTESAETTTVRSVVDTAPTAGTSLQIVASFYPLQFVSRLVGGQRVQVVNLTPAGVEPHDLELTGENTASLQDSDLVVYLGGFMPALDNTVTGVASSHALDVASSARLDLAGDPHFWLDPIRLADVADVVAAQLAEIDPTGAGVFAQNATTLRARLAELDAEFEGGLASCASTNIVTSHSAFGYLAQRYGLTQVGISGLSPESEPSPADLADVAAFVEANGVQTIYYETLIDPSVAETIARETGANTAVLDPIEGLSDDSQGKDYFEVMRANLSNLRSGQGCT